MATLWLARLSVSLTQTLADTKLVRLRFLSSPGALCGRAGRDAPPARARRLLTQCGAAVRRGLRRVCRLAPPPLGVVRFQPLHPGAPKAPKAFAHRPAKRSPLSFGPGRRESYWYGSCLRNLRTAFVVWTGWARRSGERRRPSATARRVGRAASTPPPRTSSEPAARLSLAPRSGLRFPKIPATILRAGGRSWMRRSRRQRGRSASVRRRVDLPDGPSRCRSLLAIRVGHGHMDAC